MTKTRNSSVQAELLHELDHLTPAQPILMALYPQYYNLIWEGRKRYEYRRRYIHGPSVWYTYLFQPISSVRAKIYLGDPVIASPLDIADLAEQAVSGDGEAVWQYVKGLKQGYAIPITHIDEYEGISLKQLRHSVGKFQTPNDYVRISYNPRLLNVLDTALSGPPLRSYTPSHSQESATVQCGTT